MAYHRLPFLRKLSFILLKKLEFLDTGMALSYASNIQTKLLISLICYLLSRWSF